MVYRVSEGKNYTEGSVSYDFAITQAPLVITAEDKNVVFGAKAPEYTCLLYTSCGTDTYTSTLYGIFAKRNIKVCIFFRELRSTDFI